MVVFCCVAGNGKTKQKAGESLLLLDGKDHLMWWKLALSSAICLE